MFDELSSTENLILLLLDQGDMTAKDLFAGIKAKGADCNFATFLKLMQGLLSRNYAAPRIDYCRGPGREVIRYRTLAMKGL